MSNLALLEQVSLRLSLCDSDEKFENQLQILLVPTLCQLDTTDPTVLGKVNEILLDISSMLEKRPKMQPPTVALLELLEDSTVSNAVKTATQKYFDMGFSRLDMTEQNTLAHRVIRAMQNRQPREQTALLLDALPLMRGISQPVEGPERLSHYGFDNAHFMSQFLDIVRNFMLLLNLDRQPGYQPPELPPPALNRLMLLTFVDPTTGIIASLPTRDHIINAKRAALHFVTAYGIFPDHLVLPVLFAAAGDQSSDVSSDAETAIKHRVSATEIDTGAFATLLFDLLLGTPSGPSAPHVDSRRSPCSPKHRQFIMNYLVRCTPAASMFPAALQTVFLCLNGEGTTAKLRVSGMQFVSRVYEHCPMNTLVPMAKIIHTSLTAKLIASPDTPQDLMSSALVAVGVLGRKLPDMFRNNIAFLASLFAMACGPDPAIASPVQETLHLIASAYVNPDATAREALLALLEKYLDQPVAAVRIIALRYSNRVFTKDDMHARFILLLATGDSREDVVHEANTSLYRNIESVSGPSGSDSSTGVAFYPNFINALDFVKKRLFSSSGSGGGNGSGGDSGGSVGVGDITTSGTTSVMVIGGEVVTHTSPPISGSLFIHVLRYLRFCLGYTAQVDEDEVSHVALTGKVGVRTRAIAKYFSGISVSSSIAHPEVEYLALIRRALIPEESSALHLEALKSLVELLLARPNTVASTDSLDWLLPYCYQPGEAVRELAGIAVGAAAAGLDAVTASALRKKLLESLRGVRASSLETRHGLLTACGFVFAKPLPLDESTDRQQIRMVVDVLLTSLNDPADVIICAACKALGEICRNRAIFSDSAPMIVNSSDVQIEITPSSIVQILADIAMKPTIGANSSGKADASSAKSEKVSSMSFKMQEAAITCLGLMSVGQFPHPASKDCITRLCATAEKFNMPEIHFTVGLALALITTGPYSTAIYDEYHPYPCVDAGAGAGAGVGDGAGAGASASGSVKSSPLLATLLGEIFGTWLQKPLAKARQAAGMWLVSIAKYCGEWSEVKQHLPQMQNAFADLLSEGDDFTQDIASKGLAMVYELGDAAMQSQLVSTLVTTLVEGRRATTMKFTIDSDDVVFEAGQLGKSKEGGNISTYKEICSLATELNQPNLIYSFMHLANHNAMWNSRKGAAFGFAQIAAHAQEQLQAILPALIPKLYRYQFDPNRGVHNSMSQIWKLLVRDPNKAIDTHFQAILKDIMTNMTSGVWRVRESSALALADILRGRRWAEVGKVLPELWQLSFRALDDVKESVRIAGQAACNRMRTLSIELCRGEKSTAEEAVGAVLNCLTTDGLMSAVKEIRYLTLGVMVDIAKIADAALKPYVVTLMMTLLEALSALESPSLSHLSQRVSGIENSGAIQDQLDNYRLESSRSSPIMECILRCVKQVDATILPDLIPKLIDIMKKGIGPGTKAGCAHVTSMLALQCTYELGPYSGRLLKALLSGTLIKSAPIRRDYVTAIADVARHAPHDALDQLLNKLKTMSLAHDKIDHIEASATVCYALSQRASDVFKACADGILPLAFVGRYSENENAKRAWRETWDENTGGDVAGIKFYAVEISQLILGLLQEREWTLKKQGGDALLAFCADCPPESLLPHLDQYHTVLLDNLKGRIWDGKASMVGGLVAFVVTMEKSYETNREKMSQVVAIVLKECGKKQLQYRNDVLPHLARLTLKFRALLDFPTLFATIRASIEDDKSGDSSDDDDGDAAVRQAKRTAGFGLKEDVKAAALTVLGNAWSRDAAILLSSFSLAWPLLLNVLTNSASKSRKAALVCLKELLTALIESKAAPPFSEEEKATIVDILLKTLQDKQAALRRIAIEDLIQCHTLNMLMSPFPINSNSSSSGGAGGSVVCYVHVRKSVAEMKAVESDLGVRDQAEKLISMLPLSM